MVLRDSMEEKQLDLNKPFLSVRRYSPSPTHAEALEQGRKVDCSVDKLPPLPRYKSELKSGPVGKPGNVPFVWERAPGKPKEDNHLSKCTALDRRPQASKDEVEKSVTKKESSEEVIGIGEGGSSCSAEGDEEAFVDTLEAFPRSDSFLNCSMAGGLGRLNGVELRSLERFNSLPVARQFMMGRFLPAAKAMASQAPQHTTRRPIPLTPQEIPRPEKVSNNWTKTDSPGVEQDGPMIPLRYILNGYVGESEDDDCDYYDDPPAKACGLLHRFCLLSPLPGIRHMQHHRSHSASRIRHRSSYKFPAPENRTKRNPSKEGKEDKHGSVEKLSEIVHEEDGKRLDGSSVCRRMQGNGQLCKQKEISLREAFEAEGSAGTASQEISNSPAKDGSSPPSKQCVMNFRELLASEGVGWESGSTGTGPVAEKTLYVDYVQLVKSQVPSTHFSNSRVQSNHGDLKAKNAVLLKSSSQQTEQSFVPSDIMKEKEREEIKCSTNEPEFAGEAKAKNNDVDITPAGQSATNSVVGRGIYAVNNLNSHLPPPLPKTPSDSWLLWTLHSVSSQSSSSSESPSGTKIVMNRAVASKSPPTETKWEMIVRTSNIHHGHLRSSKELHPPVQET
ncbi:hypothetical protein SAY87_018613 [Trapa incisa]|uniref:Uncharacterized protein n=1 Tax=Trapa incisa TaxID=236973 RepID=A0AAN7K301_9MYRT|nr:hypothetical protein SAY87_018613 [Trapa incisa]